MVQVSYPEVPGRTQGLAVICPLQCWNRICSAAKRERRLPDGLVFLLFFLVSGCCGLMYEVIWLRLAMAHFGVTTPIVSLVRRDYAVTVIATESSREGKRLLVNGV